MYSTQDNKKRSGWKITGRGVTKIFILILPWLEEINVSNAFPNLASMTIKEETIKNLGVDGDSQVHLSPLISPPAFRSSYCTEKIGGGAGGWEACGWFVSGLFYSNMKRRGGKISGGGVGAVSGI